MREREPVIRKAKKWGKGGIREGMGKKHKEEEK